MRKTLKNSFVGVLAAVFVFAAFAAPAKAQTVAELQAQIQALMAQLSAMSGGNTNTSATCYVHSATLRVGSTGSQVMALQKALGISADGKFGPMTASAVKAFQSSKGLSADGVVGPMTGAAIASACTPSTPSTGGNTGSTGTLSGGAGDVNLSSTSTDVEDTVKEGGEENIWGVKVEADGSDISISSIKVTFANTNFGSGSSENMNKYVDEVKVYLGDEEVGSKDMSDFSKESGSPDEFSSTISLNGAVIDEDNEERLYVAVVANDSIDTDDMDTAEIDLEVNTMRFVDATGAILSADMSNFNDMGDNDSFSFEDANTDDSIDLKSSSSNPDDTTVQVDENNKTNDVLALVARLDNDEDSSDMNVYDIPVVITIANGGTDADTVENVIAAVTLEIDGDEYDGDLSGAGTLSAAGTGTATYNFDIDGDTTVDAGDIVDVKVYVTLKEQDGNYQNALTTVTASIATSTIEVENEEGDEITVGGADRTGATLTLNTSAAGVSGYAWTTTSAQNNTAGSIILEFTVEADGGDVDVTAADITSFDTLTATGSSTIGAASLSKVSGDATLTAGSGTTAQYEVTEGDTATFRVVWSVSGSGTATVTLTNVAGVTVPNNKQVSPLLQI